MDKKDKRKAPKKSSEKLYKKDVKVKYKIIDIANELGYSKSYVYRKIKQLGITLPKEINEELFNEIIDKFDLQNYTPKSVNKSDEFSTSSEHKKNEKEFTKIDAEITREELVKQLENDYIEMRFILNNSVEMTKTFSLDEDKRDIKLYLKVCDEVRKNQQSINALVKTLDNIKFTTDQVPNFEDQGLDDFLNENN